MSVQRDAYDEALARAVAHARSWLGTVGTRPLPPRETADALRAGFAGPLPDGPSAASDVVDLLAALAEPGLMAFGSGRFFGWVIGGTLPAALAADWLVSAWDQNAAMRYATPACAAAEEAAGAWVLELLGLPAGSGVGFVTGATMANFSCLASARTAVLARAGRDVARDGLVGGPAVRVLVGEERHDSVDVALRYLGLGAPTAVAADEEGRIRLDALDDALSSGDGPTIVCLQAGNLHSGAFDPFLEAVELAHARDAWVHVDGAFGLWAAASPSLAPLTDGMERADSWATDAHKTLNVPYDCGIAIVADPAVMRSALGVHASYLVADDAGVGDPLDHVPELSRRARGVPVWAALRALGRSGVAGLVEGLARNARALAEGLGRVEGAAVQNEVVYTQVCVAFDDDDTTRAVTDRILSDGITWMSGSLWRGRRVLRVSVSNWTTDDRDVARSLDAVARAAASVRRSGGEREGGR